MKIVETVKTKKRAIQIIKNFLKNKDSSPLIENTTARCECGETQAVQAHSRYYHVVVAYCESCGSDDNNPIDN
jgi:hypothetical protein